MHWKPKQNTNQPCKGLQLFNIKCSKVVWHIMNISEFCTFKKCIARNAMLNYSAITVELSLEHDESPQMILYGNWNTWGLDKQPWQRYT